MEYLSYYDPKNMVLNIDNITFNIYCYSCIPMSDSLALLKDKELGWMLRGLYD